MSHPTHYIYGTIAIYLCHNIYLIVFLNNLTIIRIFLTKVHHTFYAENVMSMI